MDILNYDGNTYELAKKTLAIAKKEDLMARATTLEDAYRKQFDYAMEVLGDESFKKIFGSNNLNDIDLVLLTYICNEIDTAYMERINEQQRLKSEKLASNKAVDKIIQAGKSIEVMEKYKK